MHSGRGGLNIREAARAVVGVIVVPVREVVLRTSAIILCEPTGE